MAQTANQILTVLLTQIGNACRHATNQIAHALERLVIGIHRQILFKRHPNHIGFAPAQLGGTAVKPGHQGFREPQSYLRLHVVHCNAKNYDVTLTTPGALGAMTLGKM
jgi:hypothetical protein